MRSDLEDYIKNSCDRVLSEQKEFSLFSSVQVYINDELPENIDIRHVLGKIETIIPTHFAYGFDTIQIGMIGEFSRRNINALYKENTIYITNNQDNDDDMIDDIVHEIAHAAEHVYKKQIYKDKRVENEFLGKRKRLLDNLEQEGYNTREYKNLGPKYSKGFDAFLYKEVGYPLVQTLTMGLFASPYSPTSLREYFATGFEEYYIGDRDYLRKISPNLYMQLSELDDLQYPQY
tara:strand:- start:47 stop:745 length:699 start_codon:yes stop_codon:yes gene_type:complete